MTANLCNNSLINMKQIWTKKNWRLTVRLCCVIVFTLCCITLYLPWRNNDLNGNLENSEVSIEVREKLRKLSSNHSQQSLIGAFKDTFHDAVFGFSSYKRRIAKLKSDIHKNKFLQNVRKASGVACEVPELKPFAAGIRHVLKKPDEAACKGYRLTYMKGGKIYLNHTRVGDVDLMWCSVSPIVRESDSYSSQLEPDRHYFTGKTSQLHKDVQLFGSVPADFIGVECSSQNLTGYEDYLYQQVDFTVTPEVVERSHVDFFLRIHEDDKIAKRAKKNQQKWRNGLGLNVMMLGMDSTSHMNFLRNAPKSYKYMEETLNAVVLNGYNIVGDATTGALIPMLTGQTEMELPEARWKDSGNPRFVDEVYPFVWKEYVKAGYVTSYAEDRPDIATFNLRLRGFRDQPTDHYMRTFWLAASEMKEGLCVGPDTVHSVMINYLQDFMGSYKDNVKFGFHFLTDLTHADMNRLSLIDDDLLSFLKSARRSGTLNNTLLVVFSDHGARYTAIRKTNQGKFEERLPFMSFILPPWFQRSHPTAFRTLRRNTHRLTTPFDIHATLRSVLNFTEAPGSLQDRGISLLASEVPRDRECHHAGVQDHWCTCLQWEEVNISKDQLAERVTRYLVQTINNFTQDLQQHCARLRLSNVISTFRMVPNEKMLRFIRSSDPDNRYPEYADDAVQTDMSNITLTYQVTIETKPGLGQYEATVAVRPGNPLIFELGGDVSRITEYGHAADCIVGSNPSLAKFCFCKGARS